LTSLQPAQGLPDRGAAQPRVAALAAEDHAISLRAVSKRYGREPALHSLDLDIGEGEFFCLLGPSGCGKTTTLNLVGGFVTPSSGAIFIRGRQVDRLPPYARDVNTVFQSYALFPHLTVEQNVGFGLKMARVARRESARRVAEALTLVGLEGLGRRRPAELSGGQQQRVAVARALVNRPAVLLLDEPLGALDLKLRKRLQLELAQIHREVRTVFVYVTHDQEEALALADRVAVMREGRIEQVGTPRQIYRRPRTRFVADFIGESNFFPASLLGPSGQRGVLMVRPEAIRICTDERGGGFLSGAVVQTSFLGNYTRVAVRCQGCSEPVLAELHGADPDGPERLTPGRPVWLSWDPESAVALDDFESPNQPDTSEDSEEEDAQS
jgi:ABC-type Fe3+/spermidine/putrescine transport system ATPase subunit